MAEERTLLSNADTDYERGDLPLKPMLYLAIGLFLLVVIVPLIIFFAMPEVQGDVRRSLSIEPPAPRLQLDPAADLATYRARERGRLESVGWVDRAHAVAHIPIEEAMREAAEQGIEGFPKAAP